MKKRVVASKPQYNQEELKKRLTISLLGIFAILILGITAVSFFGPQIGSIFGFISVNKNQIIPQAEATISPPSLINLPKATKNKNITIEGLSDSGSTVKLFINGPEKGDVLTGADGKFVFENAALIDGRNTIFAKAIDATGKVSDRSETYVISVDSKSPDIKILEPKNGATITNLNKRVKVVGEVSERVKLKINDRLAVQKPDLTFEYLLGVEAGNVEIKIDAVDEAGNEKIEKIFIKYVKD